MATTTKKETPSVDDIAEQLEVLRADMTSLTKSLASFGSESAEQVGRGVAQRAADLRDRASHDVDRLRARAGDLAGDAENFMHERPATAIGIAVALGFVVGMLSTRR